MMILLIRVGDERLEPRPVSMRTLRLVGRHDEQDAVVLALLADAPFAAELIAEVLDLVALQRRQRHDHELIGGLFLQRLEVGLDSGAILGLEQIGVVDDAPGELWKLRLGSPRAARDSEQRKQRRAPRRRETRRAPSAQDIRTMPCAPALLTPMMTATSSRCRNRPWAS